MLNGIKKFLVNFPLLTALVLNAILFSITYGLFYASFQTVDDVGMLLRVAGICRVMEANAHMLHTNIIIGHILKYLYSVSQEIPWYGYYHVFFLYLSHVSFLYLLIRNTKKFFLILFYLLYFFLVGIYLLLNFQFTILSCIVTFAGLALILFDPPEEETEEMTLTFQNALKFPTFIKGIIESLKNFKWLSFLKFRYLFGITFICFGAMIRWWSLELALGLYAFYVVVHFYGRPLSQVFRQGLVLLLALIIGFSLYTYDKNIYLADTGGYQHWYDFRATYKTIYDYKHLEFFDPSERRSILASLGMTENDYKVLNGYFYTNRELFSVENGKKMVNMLKDGDRKIASFGSAASTVGDILSSRLAINSLLMGTLIFLLLKMTWLNTIRLISIPFMSIFLFFFLIFFLKPPVMRLIFPMLAHIAILSMLLLNWNNCIDIKSLEKKTIRLVSIFLILIILPQAFLTAREYMDHSRYNRVKRTWLNKTIQDLPNKTRLYLTWGQAIPFEYFSPFQTPTLLNDMRIFHIGTDQLTPAALQILSHLEIDDIYKAITDEELYVILRPHSKYKRGIYTTYMEEHYGLKVRPVMVENFKVFAIYRFEVVREMSEFSNTPVM